MINKGIILWASVLFCVSASAQLQDSPWPMFHHDLRHTGRSPWLGPETPRVKWTLRGRGAFNSSAAVGADGTIYVGSSSDTLYAFNPDGSVKWGFLTGGNIWSSPAVGSDGTVYVGCVPDSNLYAIDSTGSLKWRYKTGYHLYSSPAIADDGTIYIGCQDSDLYAINPDSTLKWQYSTGGPIYSSPAVGADGTVYVGSDDCSLHAINSNGTPRWTYGFLGPVRSSPAIASDGTIYINPDKADSGLYAINPDGTFKWHCDTLDLNWQGGPYSSSPAIDADGVIYVGMGDPPGLFAINPDGILKWMCPIPTYPDYCSPAVDAHKTTYIAGIERHLYAVDSTGTIKWDLLTPGSPGCALATSPAIDERRTVYLGTAGADSAVFFAVGYFRDVTPISITSPGESVYVDSTYSPEAVVKNRGDTLESFDVECVIDTADHTIYSDMVNVPGLPAGDTTLVSFGPWAVGPDPGVTYTITVVTLLGADDRPSNDTLFKVTVSVLPPGVEEQLTLAAHPGVYSLSQNYPNPANASTTIRYGLPSPCEVRLFMYDVTGQLVGSLVCDRQRPGVYTIIWDGRDSSRERVASGIYFYRLTAGDFTATNKMVVVR